MGKKPTKLALYLFEKGISQQEFRMMIKEKTGKEFTKSTISNYINGSINMQLDNAKLLAEGLGITLDKLMELLTND